MDLQYTTKNVAEDIFGILRMGRGKGICIILYFCSLGPHLEKTIKMFTYDDQTSHGLSTTPVLRVCIFHVIKK